MNDPAAKVRSRRRRIGAALVAGAAAAVFAVAVVWAGQAARGQAKTALLAEAGAAAKLRAASLRSELERQRTVPNVLAEDGAIAAMLADPDRGGRAGVNQRLESLAAQMGRPDIYVLDARGETIAASNWRTPRSFIGHVYSFRAYYSEAMRVGRAQMFAMGNTTGEPGLYISRRVEHNGAAVGVVVIKVLFNHLESEWAQSTSPTFVTDETGRVLVTWDPQSRFAPSPIGAEDTALVKGSPMLGDSEYYAHGVADGGAPGWRLHVLTPAGQALSAAAANAQIIAALCGLLLAIFVLVVWMRQNQARAAAVSRERLLAELEARVGERTQALQATNAQLSLEIDERQRAETTLHLLQDELIQANKLAVLGQIAAGVAHEINQPISAIRTYVDNAAVMLKSGADQEVAAVLDRVSQLTDRVGLITMELRTFSRRTVAGNQHTDLVTAIDGALLLLAARLRHEQVEVVRDHGSLPLMVNGDRVRLEQVIVNLLQNAIDALEGRSDGVVRLIARAEDRLVRLIVADNGPGVSDELGPRLFTPFQTTKPEGLGLGLVISRDILIELGGDLRFIRTEQPGAQFEAIFKAAQ